MKILLHYISIILFIILLPAASSCTQEGCDLETDVSLHAGIYESGTGDELKIDSLTIYGLEMPDSLLYSMAKRSTIDLPLNPSSSYSAFIIQNGNRIDTVEFIYTSKLEFLSKACGYIYLYDIEEVLFTGSDINNILIINNLINPGDEENIQIYF